MYEKASKLGSSGGTQATVLNFADVYVPEKNAVFTIIFEPHFNFKHVFRISPTIYGYIFKMIYNILGSEIKHQSETNGKELFFWQHQNRTFLC